MESANCSVRLASVRLNYQEPNYSKFIQMYEYKYYNIINCVNEIFVFVCDY